MCLEAVHTGFQVSKEILCPLALMQQHSLQLPIAGLQKDFNVGNCSAAPYLAKAEGAWP